jgi:hypothetical protein
MATLNKPTIGTLTPKYTLAELYKSHFDLILNKYTKADKQYILDNLLTSSGFVDRFVKEVVSAAEKQFDEQIIP